MTDNPLGRWSEKDVEGVIARHAWPWLPSLPEALRWLPDVNSREAKKVVIATLEDTQNGARHVDEALWGGISEAFARDSYGNERVMPAGARLLLRLYDNGSILPLKRRPVADAGDLERLRKLAQADGIGGELRDKAERVLNQKELRRMKVESPSTIEISEFEYDLLNDVFFKHIGNGGGKMVIGGVEVIKSVIGPIFSNSHKSHGWRVSIRWTDPSSGESVTVGSDTPFSSNRANDAGRNWGLGRE